MNNKFLKPDKTICILINQKGKICYSNINMPSAQEYLDIVQISDHLPVNNAIKFNVEYYDVNVDKVDLDGKEYYLILIQPNGDIYKHAYMDSLTNLYNRNYWEKLISSMSYRHIFKGFTLIVIDVDNLKQLNDNKGHLIGDKAIRIVGQAIKESIRKTDIGVRYGGDEFFILLANTKRFVVEKVIRRIKQNIDKRGKKENINIEISTGTACFNSCSDIEKIITIADSKMYKEKAEKRIKTSRMVDKLTELENKKKQ